MNRSITEVHGQVELTFVKRDGFLSKKKWSCSASAPWGTLISSARTLRGSRRSALNGIMKYKNYDQFGLTAVGSDTPTVSARGSLKGKNLDCKDLRHIDLSNKSLIGTSFRGANLSCANLEGADLTDADLSGAYLNKANLRNANLSSSTLRGTVFFECDLRGVQLRSAQMHGQLEAPMPGHWVPMEHYSGSIRFYGSRFIDVDLSHMDLSGLSFVSASFANANLASVDASDADFRDAVFYSTDLSNSKLSGANFRGAEFTQTNFSNCEDLVLD